MSIGSTPFQPFGYTQCSDLRVTSHHCGSGGTADASASGASWSNPVGVQIPASAPKLNSYWTVIFEQIVMGATISVKRRRRDASSNGFAPSRRPWHRPCEFSSGDPDASDTPSLRDRREPLVGRGCHKPGAERRRAIRGAASPRAGRAIPGCHVYQRTASRRPRWAADVIRQRGTRHRRTRSRVSDDRSGRQSKAADSSAGRGGVLNRHHCLVYYERGGRDHTWHVALFHWTPAATRFEGGGAAPAGLATVDDVRRAILAGWIEARFW